MRPRSALPLLKHLAAWGEVCAGEVRKIGGDRWIQRLCEAEVVQGLKAGCWVLTEKGRELIGLNEEGRMRFAFINHPGYRRYLLTILAEGLVSAVQSGDLQDRIFGWIMGPLAPLAREINTFYDELERSLERRLIDCDLSALRRRLEGYAERTAGYQEWDTDVLGGSGGPDVIFPRILNRLEYLPMLENSTASERMWALLPPLPLHDEPEIRAEPWSTRREGVRSSVPLFDLDGFPLFGGVKPSLDFLQDAILEQPYYAVTVHLAVAAYRTRFSGEEDRMVELLAERDEQVGDVIVVLGGQARGYLSQLLPGMVRTLGFEPLLPPDGITPGRIRNVIENLCGIEILTLDGEDYRLADDYARSLVDNRFRAVQEVGPCREALIEYLRRQEVPSPTEETTS